MRGEYLTNNRLTRINTELPPRARRILSRHEGIRLEHGTTSACAENTNNQRRNHQKPRNYLRVRGEYVGAPGNEFPNFELPPRARRILRRLVSTLRVRGTTSACAENTRTQSFQSSIRWNYLRVRGEYKSNTLIFAKCEELPPRARRIHEKSLSVMVGIGTTSACAENTVVP